MSARAAIPLVLFLGLPLAAQPDEAGTAAAVRRMRADVSALTGDALRGRRAGTPEADAAARWVAASFRRAGMLPGGVAGSYLQTFPILTGADLGPKNELVTAAGAPLGARWTVGKDFLPLALSAAGTAEGEVVFAGYGISARDLGYDDYGGIDVKDRVVLVLRFGPDGEDPGSAFAPYTPLRIKVARAKQLGARAILVVTGPATRGVRDGLVALRTDFSFSPAGLVAMSVTRPVAESLFGGASTTLGAAQKAIDASRRPRSRILAAHVALTADVAPRQEDTSNVIALLPGADATRNREFVVFGAHYDHLGLGGPGSLEAPPKPGAPMAPSAHIHHGADDNASGVASLLELARRLRARRDGLKRSALFIAFGAEEEGCLGSAHFTADPTVPLERIVAMVNLDMVGRLRHGRLDVHGLGTSPALRPLVEEANAGTKLKLTLHDGGFGPSDHSSFAAVRKPVLFLFTGRHADYHRPSDTADKLDYEGMDRVLRFLAPLAEGLLSTRWDPR